MSRWKLTGIVCCSMAVLWTCRVIAEEPGYEFVWVKTILGPCCGDSGNDLVVDAQGAVLVAGHRGGLDLDRDGKVDVKKWGGVRDSMVFKLVGFENEDGWVMGPGGPEWDNADGVASDRQGGIYAVGTFQESMKIASGEIQSVGKRDGFLVRYGEDPRVRWAVAIGGVDDDYLYKVASDKKGNAYVIGTIRGEVDIDRDGKMDVVARGDSSALVASFDPDGELLWSRASSGSGAEDGRTIAVGAEGEVYVGGFFRAGGFELQGHDLSGPEAGESNSNGFLACLVSSGNPEWVQVVSGAEQQIVWSLAIAGNGDLLVLGGHNVPVELECDGQHDLEFGSMADRLGKHQQDFNAFLERLTPEGERLWARRYTAAVNHVAADESRIVLSGSYSGPLDLDDDGRPERQADPDEQVEGFAVVLDGEGEVRHVFTVVGEDSDVVRAAGFTPDGKQLYITGYTKLGADFDNDGEIEFGSKCHQLGDVYVAMYDVEN